MENARGKIKLGVCVMEKKVSSLKPILERLESFGEFEIIYFGNKAIEDDPIDSWPICDWLIAFHSSGFPLEKAEAYAALRKPLLVNELEPQHLLHDRRKVYERLTMFGIDVPKHAVVNREIPEQELEYFIEEEDFIEVEGKRFWKPFVEKPVHGDDHKVRIYYPRSAGGGMKELFRKVNNCSSEFHPNVHRVRREGSYIYEEFLATGGTDVKVYTVGLEYAHAEARKSPVLDGKVMRNDDGKEIRYPVLLSRKEKQIAARVSDAFGQMVCGFDILRSNGRSYVCDVNGWSFVKNSHKYYYDAAHILRNLCLGDTSYIISTSPASLPSTSGQPEELRCVIAILRHGDRTPKQKIKLKVTEDKLLNLLLKYNRGRSRSEAKLKTAAELQDLLDVTRALVPHFRPESGSAEDEHAEKLQQIKAVLEEGMHFYGINRKAQLKPLKWDKGSGEKEQPVEALMVLKYGGVLTHAGRKQAEDLGRYFRSHMYTGDDLLRLHSTYRHDLKIYSSDEGRVQMTAAAFAKGLLELEGELTPILVSLVSKDYSILDGLDNASIDMGAAKARLKDLIMTGVSGKEPSATPWMADGAGLPLNAFELLQELVQLIKKVTDQVRDLKSSAGTPCESHSESDGLFLMYTRWRKLKRDLYNKRKEEFDISKISDVYDSCKYDLLHNAHLKVDGLGDLFKVSKTLADGVIPNEFGINPIQKLKIGSKVARRLLCKILEDMKKICKKPTELENYDNQSVDEEIEESSFTLNPKFSDIKAPEKNVRTRLYFTSESHMHSLLNVLRYCNLKESIQGEDGIVSHSGLELLHNTKELDYMSSIILRMFENTQVPSEDPKRYRIELSFSPGADISTLEKDVLHEDHTLPIMVPERLQEVGSHLTLKKMKKLVKRALREGQ